MKNSLCKYQRELLWYYIITVKESGLSLDKVHKLKWRNLNSTELPNLLKDWAHYQKQFIVENKLVLAITQESYIFGNPFQSMQPLSKQRLRSDWRNIINHLDKLKVLKISDRSHHRYTLTSLRRTFIEGQIASGTDIISLAKITGLSIKVLIRFYEKYS